jgi:hypothetical protein
MMPGLNRCGASDAVKNHGIMIGISAKYLKSLKSFKGIKAGIMTNHQASYTFPLYKRGKVMPWGWYHEV